MNVALLLVKEKVAEVVELADPVGCINLGRLGWFGPKADVSENQSGRHLRGRRHLTSVASGH
jgi:ABC-type uncharacterized transport system ATPase subunit